MPFPSELNFTSFLQYSPRGQSAVSRSSKVLTTAIKDDSFYKMGTGHHRAIPLAALRLSQEIPNHEVLQLCFSGDVILVPVPRRAPLVVGGLWPTNKLCDAMKQHSIAGSVLPLLERTHAVQKSATAALGKRPGPQTHYDSIAVAANRPLLGGRHHLVIVDDVVTRGATFFGCYARLRETFPDVRISCFALIRTISSGEVDSILAPTTGTITLNPLHREP